MPKLLSAHPSLEVTRDSSAPNRKSHQRKRDDSASRSERNIDPRIQRLLACESSFVGSDSFRNPATARRLRMFAEHMEREALRSANRSYSAQNATLTTCTFGITELLSPSEEREAFLCLNYLKWQANVLRATIDPTAAEESLIVEIEALHRQALVVRDRIISANLRLVMSIAKAQVQGRLTFDELFSEGVPVLMRAVEKFDVRLELHRRPHCIKNVGKLFFGRPLVGVSKERARQLLNRALAHLRVLVEESRYADLQELVESDAVATSPQVH